MKAEPAGELDREKRRTRQITRNVMRFTDVIMKMHLLLLFLLFSTSAVAGGKLGTVCFGKNLAKPYSEHTDRIYIKIDNSDMLYFNRPSEGAVLTGLDINKNHMVKVYFDNQLVRSWPLSFSDLGSYSVIIWRSSGSWRMEPSDESKCN
jgi:hypothetical protein